MKSTFHPPFIKTLIKIQFMTAKFKIGDMVHLRDYDCDFKITRIVQLMEGQIAYRLAIMSPIPKRLSWLPLVVRIIFANDSELTLTAKQRQKNRTQKINTLLK